ncbi:MAG: type II secretion system protein [Candidatus Borkfalkiaceae bacterium]|nr:type II secretion system protein [Christensenellaceae bacterium]
MKNVKIRRKGRGFTLVELVIVIAVIAVLSAVLIPVFGNVITSAKVAALRANIVTLNSNLMLRAIKDDNRSSYSAEEINKILDDMDFDLENTPKGYSIWYDQSINNLRLLKNDSAFSETPSGNESGVRKAYAATDSEKGNRAVEALNPYNPDLLYIDRTNKTIKNLLAEIKGDVKDGNKQLGLIATTENKYSAAAAVSANIATEFETKYKELATELKMEAAQSDALVASFDFDHTLFIGSSGMYFPALKTDASKATINCNNAMVDGSVTEIRNQKLQRTADKDSVQINMTVSIIVPNRVEFIASAAFASIGTSTTTTKVTVEINPGTTIFETGVSGANVTIKDYSTILDENSIKYNDANIVYGRDYECVYSDTCQYFYMNAAGIWQTDRLVAGQSITDVQSDAMVKYLAPEFIIHNEDGVNGFFSKVNSIDRLYISSNKVGYLTKYTAIVLLVEDNVTKGYKFSNIGYVTNLNAYTFESYDPIRHTGNTAAFPGGKGRIEIKLPEGSNSLYNYKDRLSVKVNYKPVVNNYSQELLMDGTIYYAQKNSSIGASTTAQAVFVDGKFVVEFDRPESMTMGSYSTLTSQIESVEVYYTPDLSKPTDKKLILVRNYN